MVKVSNLTESLERKYETLLKESADSVCCLCGAPIIGYGNNPYPLADEGTCCDECNNDVINARLSMLRYSDEEDNEEQELYEAAESTVDIENYLSSENYISEELEESVEDYKSENEFLADEFDTERSL